MLWSEDGVHGGFWAGAHFVEMLSKAGTQGALMLIAIACALLLGPAVEAGDKADGTGPDVTVIYLGSTTNFGSSGGVQSYSVGTTSCNVGVEPLWWCNDVGDPYCETNQHPVIAQNIYRLDNGRLEQIGMSWLKHGFLSTNSTDVTCGPSCQSPTYGGDQLGIGCTDTYSSGLNGNRPLGPRSEVNPAAGFFPYPYTDYPITEVTDQRLQVSQSDLDPSLNPDARYWVEGQYIAADDAAAGNAWNNASHREVQVSAGSFNLQFIGGTVRDKPAIYGWQAVDPTVEILRVDSVPKEEIYHIARKVTQNPDSTWHMEYAIHNLSSNKAARRFMVQFPGSTTITGAGFNDVDHHSGEPYDTADWDITIDDPAGTITWSTGTYVSNPNANALRWGTMFSFWFDVNRAAGGVSHELEMFRDGSVVSFSYSDELFADGFESGLTDEWSTVGP